MAWDNIEALLLAMGATLTEGNGSRVKLDLEGRTIASPSTTQHSTSLSMNMGFFWLGIPAQHLHSRCKVIRFCVIEPFEQSCS